ncbi:metal-dependent hydrolase [Halomicrococcus sp. SG-WS-1]|uniref:metal-dependent hydrolase n=1 Tax=Halomicrococcus sp. SG-WS-1 TaxID=3439057 RepID=UPI003F7A7FD0
MWPWEHLAFGYLCYSLTVHLVRRSAPETREVLALAVASVLPDLVDKPLSWSLGLFPSGYSIAHSVFVAPVVVAFALALAGWRGRLRYGAAFAVGYCSHLVGDVIYPAVLGEGLKPEVLLWPVVEMPAYENDYGLVERFVVYFSEYLEMLAELELSPVLAFELVLAASVFLLWVYDGMPGVPTPYWLSAGEQRDRP